MKDIRSNVISKEKLREVQRDTLNLLASYLMKSAGPAGSTTMIPHENAYTTYSKDGKTILEQIKFVDTIENSIVNEMVEMAAHIVSTVGDGTTSVVVLSAMVFDELYKKELNGYLPYEIVEDFQHVADCLKEIIESNKKDVTVEDIYKISMIATNGNHMISDILRKIYAKYGNGVYINLDMSSTTETSIKAYDGLTLPYGYINASFINNTTDHSAHIRNARIYAFKDNVDTPEMIAFFDKIIYSNIIQPIMENPENIIPTVILCPVLSRDLSTTMDKITNLLYGMDQKGATSSKPPICIITDIMDDDEYEDLAKLCNAKMICKYINPERQKEDIEAGLAPSIDTIDEWYGYAEEVISAKNKTAFINPSLMYKKENNNTVYDKDQNPVLSEFYKGMVHAVEEELQSLIDNAASLTKIADTRRRLNNLKANMVDLFIGGITTTDRDSVKHLAEDAICNCRSASTYGYGYGANFEAMKALIKLKEELNNTRYKYVLDILYKAYSNFIIDLYATRLGREEAINKFADSIKMGQPYNLRDLAFNNSVLSSIKSDQVIIGCIANIISIMFTTNQAVVMNPVYNVYEE